MKKIIKYIKPLPFYLFLHFTIAVFVGLCARWVIFEWSALPEIKDWKIFISPLLWICVLALIAYLILNKLGINPEKFFGFCFINGLAILFFTLILWFITKSYNLNFIDKNYIGVYGTDEVEGEDGEYETNNSPTFVYNNEDSRIKKQIEDVNQEHEEAYEEKFIFWQTAFAAGYDPKYIKQYIGKDSSQTIELLLTTGILVLAECFVNSLFLSILYLAIPLILFLFNRPFLFKDYFNFKEKIDRHIIK